MGPFCMHRRRVTSSCHHPTGKSALNGWCQRRSNSPVRQVRPLPSRKRQETGLVTVDGTDAWPLHDNALTWLRRLDGAPLLQHVQPIGTTQQMRNECLSRGSVTGFILCTTAAGETHQKVDVTCRYMRETLVVFFQLAWFFVVSRVTGARGKACAIGRIASMRPAAQSSSQTRIVAHPHRRE